MHFFLSHLGLSPCPNFPQGRTHSQGLRSLAGHSNLPCLPRPCHNPLLWPSHGSPTVPHPHFWPEFDRGNSSWQTPKAEMRDSQTRCALVEGGQWGMGSPPSLKGRGGLRPCPLCTISSGSGAEAGWGGQGELRWVGVHVSQESRRIGEG